MKPINYKDEKVLIVPNTHFGVAFVGRIVTHTIADGIVCYALRNASVIINSGIGPDWCTLARSPKERNRMNASKCPNGKIKLYFQFGYTIKWFGVLPNLKGE